jgi:hypothetical protein
MKSRFPIRLWICLLTFSVVLGAVSMLSVRAAPSAANAMVAIRVAHLELFWARIAFRDPAVDEAERHLKNAWSALGQRSYSQSIIAASHALQRVRDIKGELPSLYSARSGDTERAPES